MFDAALLTLIIVVAAMWLCDVAAVWILFDLRRRNGKPVTADDLWRVATETIVGLGMVAIMLWLAVPLA